MTLRIPKYAAHEINAAGNPTEEGMARLASGAPTPGYEEASKQRRAEYEEEMKATTTAEQIQRLAIMAAGVSEHKLTPADVIAIRAVLCEIAAHRAAKKQQDMQCRTAQYSAGVKDAAEVCFSAARLARTVIETNCFAEAELYEIRGNEILALLENSVLETTK